MRGFVPTPRVTVDLMVERLFRDRIPRADDAVLDPGCGTGEFIDGILRWCRRKRLALPRMLGVESNPRHLPVLRAKYEHVDAVTIEHSDFLTRRIDDFDFIVGNPPYVAITSLSEHEKSFYRKHYATARGRFDLYLLFFEKALRCLATNGRMVFITPEKYLYVETARPLRALLSHVHVEQIQFMKDDTFGDLVTYPTITTLRNAAGGTTRIMRRNGRAATIKLPHDEQSWLPVIEGSAASSPSATLADVCDRISCGVATGADAVFVRTASALDPTLRSFAYPTIAGRQLTSSTCTLPRQTLMLIPYDAEGHLLSWSEMGAFGRYVQRAEVRRKLLARTCARRKPWYAFHETPTLRAIRRPKILCKDICERPRFWIDRSGDFVPRHSVYYLVPRDRAALDILAEYLNSSAAHRWLAQNCQRASKGFLRLQSRVLQRMPLPEDVVAACGGGFPTYASPQQELLAYAE